MRIPPHRHGVLLLVLCLSWGVSPFAAFHPSLLLPRRLARRLASSPSSSQSHPLHSSSSTVAAQRASEQPKTTEKGKPLPVSPVPLIPEIPTKTAPSKEAGMSSVASLAMWEVILELGQRQVIFNVLQPREELNELLLEARQGKRGGARSSSSGSSSTTATTSKTPLPTPPVLDKKEKIEEERSLHDLEKEGATTRNKKAPDVLHPSSVPPLTAAAPLPPPPPPLSPPLSPPPPTPPPSSSSSSSSDYSSPPPPLPPLAAVAKPKPSPPQPFSKKQHPLPPPPPPPTTTTTTTTTTPQPIKTESRSLPPPALAAATVPVFTSIADALAWACKLSEEEISVELDFLHIEEGAEGGRKERREGLTHTELARLLARAVLVERASEGGKEEGVGGKATLATAMTGSSSIAAGAGALQNTEGVVRPLPSLVKNAKSKARQRRLLEQQQQRYEGGVGRVVVTEDEEGERREGGREGHVLDLDHARQELAALRSRALETAASLDSTGSSSSSSSSSSRGKGATRDRIPPSSSSSSSSFPSSSSSSRRPPLPSRKINKNNKYSSHDAYLFNDAYDQVKASEGGDLALRVFEKMSRGADKALDWATHAKGMARDAMIAASLNEEDIEPRTRNKKNIKTSDLQQRSRKLLGPRGRRWSKLTGHVTRAWAESAWQVVMALASWAGGGMLPGRYVLLGAGLFALLLRQGVGTFCAALLVVRTCSSTLRNMIEEEEEEGGEGGVGMGF